MQRLAEGDADAEEDSGRDDAYARADEQAATPPTRIAPGARRGLEQRYGS